ncbi:hypothetical protein DRQ05_00800, partial [bacterium]
MTKASRYCRYFFAVAVFFALNLGSAAARTGSYGNKNADNQKINTIKVVGVHKLKENFVIKAAGIKTGDFYTEEKAKRWKRKLEKLAAVDVAVIRAFPAEGGGVNLFIVVSEGKTVHAAPIISRGLTNKWSYGASYSDSDFRGKNESIKLKGMAGGTNLFEASWGQQAAYPLKMFGFEISAGYIDYSYPFRDFKAYMLDDRIKRIKSSLRLVFAPAELLEIYSAFGVEVIDVADPMLIDQG